MKKAHDIQRERMWPARKTELERLDIDMEYQRADERDDVAEKRRIVEQKQALKEVWLNRLIKLEQYVKRRV